MKGKIFPEVNSYGLDWIFGGISCIIVAHLIGIPEIILKNTWQLLFCANGRKL